MFVILGTRGIYETLEMQETPEIQGIQGIYVTYGMQETQKTTEIQGIRGICLGIYARHGIYVTQEIQETLETCAIQGTSENVTQGTTNGQATGKPLLLHLLDPLDRQQECTTAQALLLPQ